MRDAVIVEAVRTPVGKRNGGLAGVHPVDLSACVLDALVQRSGIGADLVDDVVWGCVMQVGEQSLNIARRYRTPTRSALKPAFRPDGVITAANSSQISDGSAALLITTSEKAADLGRTPIARVHTTVLAAHDPVTTLVHHMRDSGIRYGLQTIRRRRSGQRHCARARVAHPPTEV